MQVTVFFYFQLISGSVFGATFSKRRFEEIFPFTLFGIVFFLFGFGCVGNLRLGWTLLLVLIPVLYMIAGGYLLITRKMGAFLSRFVTPGFVLFTIMYILLNVLNEGKLASSWDEFSHWMDSIKAMTLLDDFVANPEARSVFPSYPPGMTLLQYFLQRTTQMCENAGFCEWRMYTAFQLFGLSVLFPLLKDLRFRRVDRCVLVGIILMLCPLLFFSSYYTKIVIDPVMGLFAGAGLAYLALDKERGLFSAVYLACLCGMLVLLKDVGKYEAAILVLTYMAVTITHIVKNRTHMKNYRGKILGLFLPGVCTAAIVLLWKNVLTRMGTRIRFGNALNLSEYAELFFLRNGTDYHQKVADNVRKAFFQPRFIIGDTGISISYFILLVSLALLLVLTMLYRKRKAKNDGPELNSDGIIILVIVGIAAILQAVLYAYAIGATYIANFSQGEATRLVSYERYMNISFLPVWILLLFLLLDCFTGIKLDRVGLYVLVLAVLLTLPIQEFVDFLGGTAKQKSADFRAAYDLLARQIEWTCGDDANILLIAQESKGSEYYIERYLVRPNRIFGPWSIGKKFYTGDTHSKKMSKKELQQKLKEEYDYVVLYKTNDYFRKHYKSLFLEGIYDQNIYKVDKSTGKLELCD